MRNYPENIENNVPIGTSEACDGVGDTNGTVVGIKPFRPSTVYSGYTDQLHSDH